MNTDIKNIENLIKILFDQWVEKKKELDSASEKIQYAGPMLGKEEYSSMLDAIFNDWWSGGKFTLEAERKLASLSNRKHALLSNSGSSANLMMMSAAKSLYFKDGDKIATLSCGFPTTVNPIISNGLIPVFLDIDLDTLSLNPALFESCLKNDSKIKGLFIAHTLGFKNDINSLLQIARKYNVEVFFDCCDAYGTKYNGKPIQEYGKASTFSFYVAHHVTMGEGGGVCTNDDDFHIAMRGFRNWGRYCASTECCVRSLNKQAFCPSSKLTTNNELPKDYMVNYQYEWLGYNLKPLELQAAILIEQLNKLDKFDEIRKKNYQSLYDYFQKNVPSIKTWQIDEDVSPFSFPILLPEKSKYNRKHLIDFLMKNKIECRLLFGGNLTKHPAYQNNKDKWELFGTQNNSDIIMNRFLMLGVSPIITTEKIAKLIAKLDEFFTFWETA
jgi:CDP-6-deoxy-D-xylo-4-hexulose-3-dehydrase